MPVYRDWDRVPVLAALAGQSRRDFEVILADNDPGNLPPPLPDHGLALRIIA